MIEKVIVVKNLQNGFVRISAKYSWAQMPQHVWECLEQDEEVDSTYVFDSDFHQLYK